MTTVAVVGAGAAGALVATHLLSEATARCHDIRVVLIDPRPDTARGVAYSTADPRHLLNVPARAMSALHTDSDHFTRWLDRNSQPFDEWGFVPRFLYGHYLEETLRSLAHRSRPARFERVQASVLTAHRDSRNGDFRLRLSDGRELTAAALILALGHFGGSRGHGLSSDPRLIADPWRLGAFAAIPASADVLCIGSGLTMVDVAISLDRPGRVIHAVSRNGLLPAAQISGERPIMPAPELPAASRNLESLERLVMQQLEFATNVFGDWRPGFDSLRSITSNLWASLDETDQRRFVHDYARRWETARHRMAPATAESIFRMRAEGRLQLHTGTVAESRTDKESSSVGLTDGTELDVAAIVDCTGPQFDVTSSSNPLLQRMFISGMARPGPLCLGLDTADDGAVLDVTGESHRLYALGPLRRGNLWETTAIPEIRDQAATIAISILETGRRSSRTQLV